MAAINFTSDNWESYITPYSGYLNRTYIGIYNSSTSAQNNGFGNFIRFRMAVNNTTNFNGVLLSNMHSKKCEYVIRITCYSNTTGTSIIIPDLTSIFYISSNGITYGTYDEEAGSPLIEIGTFASPVISVNGNSEYAQIYFDTKEVLSFDMDIWARTVEDSSEGDNEENTTPDTSLSFSNLYAGAKRKVEGTTVYPSITQSNFSNYFTQSTYNPSSLSTIYGFNINSYDGIYSDESNGRYAIITFSANNLGKSSSEAGITLTAQKNFSNIIIKANYKVERGYDKLYAYINNNTNIILETYKDNTLDPRPSGVDGNGNATDREIYNSSLSQGEKIIFYYTKDGSVNGNSTTGNVELVELKLYINIEEEKEIIGGTLQEAATNISSLYFRRKYLEPEYEIVETTTKNTYDNTKDSLYVMFNTLPTISGDSLSTSTYRWISGKNSDGIYTLYANDSICNTDKYATATTFTIELIATTDITNLQFKISGNTENVRYDYVYITYPDGTTSDNIGGTDFSETYTIEEFTEGDILKISYRKDTSGGGTDEKVEVVFTNAKYGSITTTEQVPTGNYITKWKNQSIAQGFISVAGIAKQFFNSDETSNGGDDSSSGGSTTTPDPEEPEPTASYSYTGTYSVENNYSYNGSTYTKLKITTSGTLTLSNYTNPHYLWMCGGGQAGENGATYTGSSYSSQPGNGGNGAGIYTNTLTNNTYTINIGNGGISDGASGGNTTINNYTAYGATTNIATNAGGGTVCPFANASNNYFKEDYTSYSNPSEYITTKLTFYPVFNIQYNYCAGGGGGGTLLDAMASSTGSSNVRALGTGGNGGKYGGSNTSATLLAGDINTTDIDITVHTGGNSNYGNKGGDHLTASLYELDINGSATSFYGSGGGGGGAYYNVSSGLNEIGAGGSGAQGVVFILIPNE